MKYAILLAVLMGTGLGQDITMSATSVLIVPADGTGMFHHVTGPAKKVIQPMTPAEIKKLAEAKAQLDAAKLHYSVVQGNIAQAHGEDPGQPCDVFQTVVTLWGDYALVDTEQKGGCISW